MMPKNFRLTTPWAVLLASLIFAAVLLIFVVLLSQTSIVIRLLGHTVDGETAAHNIKVSATGEAFLQPDTVSFFVGVKETKKTSKQAIEAANVKINEVRQLALSSGVQEKDIKTSSFRLNPDYNYVDGRRVLNGQTASQTLSFKLRNIDPNASEAAALIDQVAGINNIIFNGVNFTAEDDEQAISEARAQAVAKARQKADELARATQVKIITPLSVVENIDKPGIYRNMEADYAAALDSVTTQKTELSTGELRVTVQVSIVYGIQ